MRILENNYKQSDSDKNTNNLKPYPRECICNDCGSKLEYDKSDIRIGALGAIYLDCPLCKYENMIYDNENTIDLTKDNVEFPVHFFHTSKENGAVDCCNEKNVKDSIKTAINFFRKNKDEFDWYTEMGNIHISVSRYDGDKEYYVVVTNDYYSTYIPFEDEDY